MVKQNKMHFGRQLGPSTDNTGEGVLVYAYARRLEKYLPVMQVKLRYFLRRFFLKGGTDRFGEVEFISGKQPGN